MKVSVIIPCFNVERYITSCIDSVLHQTHRDIEIICINDGSTDNTKNVILDYTLKEPSRVALFNQSNKGAPSARNYGLRKARGSYIQFLDADDLLMPDKIQHQITLAEGSNMPDMIVGSYRRQDENERILTERVYHKVKRKEAWIMLFESNLGNTCANLFKSTLFKTDGIEWNEKLASSQEYNLMFQILKRSPLVIFDDRILTTIRTRRSGSISQANFVGNLERHLHLRSQILDYVKSENIPFDFKRAYQKFFTTIRILYPYNKKAAKHYYGRHIPSNFKPVANSATTKLYVLIYNILGFQSAEKIKSFLGSKKRRSRDGKSTS